MRGWLKITLPLVNFIYFNEFGSKLESAPLFTISFKTKGLKYVHHEINVLNNVSLSELHR